MFCHQCKEEIKDSYVKITIVYETRYPGKGKILFHINCFQEVAGKHFINKLNKDLQTSQPEDEYSLCKCGCGRIMKKINVSGDGKFVQKKTDIKWTMI